MPMAQVRQDEAISRSEFHCRLLAWLGGCVNEERIDGHPRETTGGVAARVYVESDGDLYYLNADASRNGVLEYLTLILQHGPDLSWSIVPNRDGVLNAVGFGPTEGRVTRFPFYIVRTESCIRQGVAPPHSASA